MIKTISNYYIKHNIIAEDEIETIEYGLKLYFLKISHVILMLIIGAIFKRILITLVFIINFSSIREIFGGAHAKSLISCYIISLCMCVSNIILHMFYSSTIISILIYLIIIILIAKLSLFKSKRYICVSMIGVCIVLSNSYLQSTFLLSSFYGLLLIIIENVQKQKSLSIASASNK